jgi:hypothetical protein
MTDATLIAADAALDSLVHHDPEAAAQEAKALRGPNFDFRISTRACRAIVRRHLVGH